MDWHKPQLWDTDSYMRLVRVEQLQITHDWYDATIPRSNWPYGETLHWSRLLDIILFVGASIAAPIFGSKAALFWWGMYLGPVVHIGSLAALFWAAAPLFKSDGILRLGLIFLGQAGIWSYCYIGRPDHHGILLLLFILLLGCCVRMVNEGFNPQQSGAYAGLIAAAAMWVSVESIIAVFLVLGVLTLLWVWRYDQYAGSARIFCLLLVVGSILFMTLETPPSNMVAIIYDKLSMVHVVFFAFIYLFWVQASWFACNKSVWRAGTVAVFSVLLDLVVSWLFPGFLRGPFAEIDPRIIPIWLDKVKEVQPLLIFSRNGFAQMILYLGPLIVCLPYGIYLLSKRYSNFPRVWLVYLVGLALYVPLSLFQVRWAAYAEAVMVFPVASNLNHCINFIEKQCSRIIQIWARIAFTLLFCLFSLGFGVSMSSSEVEQSVSATNVSRFLSEPNTFGATPKTILANIDFGPELLYRTPHRVVATPYHRNGDGIIFLHEVMSAQTDRDVYTLLQQRDVDLILFSSSRVNDFAEDSFYRRLLEGHRPIWLKNIELPEYVEKDIYLFSIEKNKTEPNSRREGL